MTGASADIILTSSSAFMIFLILANGRLWFLKSVVSVDAIAAAVADGCAGRRVAVVRAELEVKDDRQTVRIDLLAGRAPSFDFVVGIRMASELSRQLLPYLVPARDLVDPCSQAS
ncbi:hypothetical protein Hanom_Chr09g00786741 [Helianthus anomalus]